MVQCPACSFKNDEFATICSNCRAFLQNKIPNLNFFDTSWGILESPFKTFKIIGIAEHKNYGFFLFCCFGIAVSFTAAWYLKLGAFFESLMDLIPFMFGVGVILGCVFALVVPFLHQRITKAMGATAPVRQSYGVLAYSLVPILASLVLVLPIELLTFGMYMFTSNPHPAVIKPVSYYMLVGFDVLFGVWALVLAALGTRVVQGISVMRSAFAVASLLIVVVAILAAGAPGLIALIPKWH
ncbi:MAG: Yip1 family protein [Bacteroidota bacterium]